jgi:DNA-directed RNA polymerase subunit omega
MAANRVRQLRKGAEPTLVSKNKDIVVSLREIAAGKVIETDKTDQPYLIETSQEMLQDDRPEEIVEHASDETDKEEEPASEDG